MTTVHARHLAASDDYTRASLALDRAKARSRRGVAGPNAVANARGRLASAKVALNSAAQAARAEWRAA